MAWIVLILALVIQAAAFWFVSHGYCRLLLWANNTMQSARKWLFVVIVYTVLVAPLISIPLLSLWAIEIYGEPVADRGWLYVCGLFLNLVVIALTSRGYSEEMKQAGYWK